MRPSTMLDGVFDATGSKWILVIRILKIGCFLGRGPMTW